ncbi:MAG: hypothetical protein II579_07700 [Treponema sp.]|nr:hypothetical protein [Treponema sp.]MBQ2572334.1 hypothetical protein [Treponema sp.]
MDVDFMDEVLFALPFVYWLIRDLAIFYGLCGVPRGPTRSIPRSKLRCEFGTASPPLQSRVGCSDFKIIFFFFTNRGYCATIICVTLKLYFVSFYRKAPKALVFRPSLAAVLLPPFPREFNFSFLPVFVSECQP